MPQTISGFKIPHSTDLLARPISRRYSPLANAHVPVRPPAAPRSRSSNTSCLAAQIILFNLAAPPPAPAAAYLANAHVPVRPPAAPRTRSEPVYLPPTPHASPPRASSSTRLPRRQRRPPPILSTPMSLYALSAAPRSRSISLHTHTGFIDKLNRGRQSASRKWRPPRHA
jgi:hypothetical protein